MTEMLQHNVDVESKSLEDMDTNVKLGKYVIMCTIVATISSTLLGYDIGVMGGALTFVSEDLHLGMIQQEIIVGSLNLVSVVGGAIAGRLSDAIGRRLTMATAAAIFFLGAIIMAVASSFAILLLGRLVAGIGVGFALMIAPVYSAELSPAKVRGSLVTLTEVFINFGILLGYLVSFALEGLPTHLNWRLMLGLGAFPALLLGAGVLVLPESPRWLVTQKRMSEAREILLRTSKSNRKEAIMRLEEIMETVGFKDPDASRDPRPEEFEEAFGNARKQGEGVWRELLRPTRTVRWMLISALGLHFFQQANGIDAAVYYSPIVFGEAGVKSRIGKLGATVGVGFCKFIFIFIATALVDKVGRKPLLLVSSTGITICLAILGTAFTLLGMNSANADKTLAASRMHGTSKVGAAITIVTICAYVGFFSIGYGPISWVYVSEIFPLRLRAQAVGLSVVMNRLVSGTVGLTFLSISKAITPAGTFFLYGGLVLVSIAFIYFYLPETKGKSLEELQMFFEGRQQVRHPDVNLPNLDGNSVREPENNDGKSVSGDGNPPPDVRNHLG